MSTIREDGSVRSANNPEWDNRYQIRDYGTYRGVVRSVVYTDDDNNDSGTEEAGNEVMYDVMIIGGDRDGQIFRNARLMRTLGGFANFEEVTLKALEGITKADPTSLIAVADRPIAEIPNFNGDVVYIQFLNGDTHLPLIIGLGYHQKATAEAEESDGPRYRRQFNGILTEITKDGEYSWTKANGAYLPVGVNLEDPLYPYVSQFVPFPTQEEAWKLTIGNKYNILLESFLGLNLSIDGVADEVALSTTAGAKWTLNGLSDSFEVETLVGTAIKVSGTSDSLELSTTVGAAIKIDGLGDEISIKAAFGDSITVSAASGIQASTPSGTSLSMKLGDIDLKSAGQAKLSLQKTGFIKFGNASGDILAMIGDAFMTLGSQTAAGFGAPTSTVAYFIQLAAKWKLFTG